MGSKNQLQSSFSSIKLSRHSLLAVDLAQCKNNRTIQLPGQLEPLGQALRKLNYSKPELNVRSLHAYTPKCQPMRRVLRDSSFNRSRTNLRTGSSQHRSIMHGEKSQPLMNNCNKLFSNEEFFVRLYRHRRAKLEELHEQQLLKLREEYPKIEEFCNRNGMALCAVEQFLKKLSFFHEVQCESFSKSRLWGCDSWSNL